ncbi:hypothetical protein KIH39_16535 [Telmatocola sphagniphila]|uniref:Uncharacterized protein n=1 Tax=Telmatocola sphagniphila TaxID=1123043 RepID=A0A8E6B3I4_9BACT|nr:hypothetical protein [Telmatocola sphagniphila]QVL30456.1 hypothetical protein KIH39_16535 [Telmatocola sphagniphila]
MIFAKIRLYIAAVLFFGWIAYLAYLALNFNHPVILSRSQLLTTEWAVVADIKVDEKGDPSPEVQVVEDLHWDKQKPELPKSISIINLADANYPEKKKLESGKHLLLLGKKQGDQYTVALTPNSPGEHGGRVYLYPWNPEIEKQFQKYRSP